MSADKRVLCILRPCGCCVAIRGKPSSDDVNEYLELGYDAVWKPREWAEEHVLEDCEHEELKP